MSIITRRSLITGLASLIAAPAIVRAESLMPVRAIIQAPNPLGRLFLITHIARNGEVSLWPEGGPITSAPEAVAIGHALMRVHSGLIGMRVGDIIRITA